MEINARVNYPIKTCLIGLQRSGDINMDCPHQKFCVSWFSIRVAAVGTTLAVRSWNDHTIPGIPRVSTVSPEPLSWYACYMSSFQIPLKAPPTFVYVT